MVRKEAKKVVLKDAEGNYIVPVIDPADKGGGYTPNIFDMKWSDHLQNDIRWLRGDTFSWQPGTVYEAAYNKLVQEYDDTSSVVTVNANKVGAVNLSDNGIASDFTSTAYLSKAITLSSDRTNVFPIRFNITTSGDITTEQFIATIDDWCLQLHIGIDSKFPLEHYQQMVDRNLSNEERKQAEKAFVLDMKKHIDAISSKYIIPNVTSDQAILFLPAEAIFAEVNAYHQDIINYAYKKKVWITSPTTLISTLTVVEMIIKNMERDKYASIIHDELNKLGMEFSRYRERWDKLARSIQTVNKDVENVYITTDKITKRFESINKADINQIEMDDN